MFANQRVMMLRQKVIEHHGRIEDIRLFDCDPTPELLEQY